MMFFLGTERDENKENFAVPRSRPKTKSSGNDTPRPKSSNRPTSAGRPPVTPMSKLIKNQAPPPPAFDGEWLLSIVRILPHHGYMTRMYKYVAYI